MPELYDKDGKKIDTHVVSDKEVHDKDHHKTDWIDKDGNIHKAGDTGGIFSDPKTIGTWDGDTLRDKDGNEIGHK